MLTETATADGWTDTKSSTDLEKTEELRFLSMENLRVSKSGDLIGCSVAVTGSRGCVLSNCVFFPVPQQSQHRPGWGMCVSATHTPNQLVELPREQRALGARCGCREGLLPGQQLQLLAGQDFTLWCATIPAAFGSQALGDKGVTCLSELAGYFHMG